MSGHHNMDHLQVKNAHICFIILFILPNQIFKHFLATLLVKFEKGMQSKISIDACTHTKKKSFVGPIRYDRLVLISFWE